MKWKVLKLVKRFDEGRKGVLINIVESSGSVAEAPSPKWAG